MIQLETELDDGTLTETIEKESCVIANPIHTSDITDNIDHGTGDESNAAPDRSLLTRSKGIVLMMSVSVVATVQGSIAFYLSTFPTGMFLIISGIYTFLFLSVLLSYHNLTLWNFSMKKWVASRVALAVLAAVCKTWSFQNLPIGDASALVFTAPLFTSVIARIFIGRKFTIVTVFALLSGIAGVCLITKPSFIFKDTTSEVPGYYKLVPLLAALSLGTSFIFQEKISSKVSPVTVSFYTAVLQVATGIGWSVYEGVYPLPECGLARYLLVVCGLCYTAGRICLNRALKYESAPTASILRNLDTAFAFIVQVAIFDKPAETLSVLGAVLIMMGTVSIALSKIFDVTFGIEF